jgi:hypothetical protein
MSDPGITKASDYAINKLQIITSGGNTIDIKDIVVETSIYQDIFSTVLSGQILVTDGHDMIARMAFCGNEYLRMSIDKPTLENPIERIFRIYKVSHREPNVGNDNAQNYILNFCSEELILSLSMLVSKSYKQQTYSSMVTDICQNILKIPDFDSSKIETTLGNYSIIIPSLRPFEAINFLASRSYGSGKNCFFFFETFDGYQFSSLQNLYSGDTHAEYVFDNKRLDSEPANDLNAINTLSALQDYDLITMIGSGAFAARLLTVDFVNQKQKTIDYGIDDKQNKNMLLNKYMPINDYTDRNNNALYKNFDAYYRTVTTFGENIDLYMLDRAQQMAMLNNSRLKYNIPGDVILKAGSIIKIKYPIFEYTDTKEKTYNDYKSTKFLVTAVRHIFTINGYTTQVELSQDSYDKGIPASVAPQKLRNTRK